MSTFIQDNHKKKLKITHVINSNVVKLEGSDREIVLYGLIAFEDTPQLINDTSVSIHPLTQESKNYISNRFLNKYVMVHSPNLDNDNKSIKPIPREINGRLTAILYQIEDNAHKTDNSKSLQEIIISLGYAYYDSKLRSLLKQIKPITAPIPPSLVFIGAYYQQNYGYDYILKQTEIQARIILINNGPERGYGIWKSEYANNFTHKSVVHRLYKASISELLAKPKLNKLKQTTWNAVIVEEAAEIDKKKLRKQKKIYTNHRKYSDNSVGLNLKTVVNKYLPKLDSNEIITRIVNGLEDRSTIMIGSIWCGIPTEYEQDHNEGPSSHPVAINELKKDGDIRAILGQGFVEHNMGERPPYEGISISIEIDERGIETFLVPLLGLLRLDPILPVRNLHLARFANPMFTNEEYYSDIFGSLPASLQSEANSKSRRSIDAMYLYVPVYMAFEKIYVESRPDLDNVFSITLQGQVADVSTTLGKLPKYTKTIEEAFNIHKERYRLMSKVDNKELLKIIATELGESASFDSYEDQLFSDDIDFNISDIEIIKNDITQFNINKQRTSSSDSYVSISNRLFRVRSTYSNSELKQLLTANDDNETKIKLDNILHYTACYGDLNNAFLLRNVLFPFKLSSTEMGIKNDLIDNLIQTRGFSFPIGRGVFHRRIFKDITYFESAAVLSNIANNERTFAQVVSDTVIPAKPNRIGDLFNQVDKNKTGEVTAYPFRYTNMSHECVLGIDNTPPIMDAMELSLTNKAEHGRGSIVTNLDIEFVGNQTIPSFYLVKAKGHNYIGNIFDSKNHIAKLIGNIEKRSTQSSIIEIDDTDRVLGNSNGKNSIMEILGTNLLGFIPELTPMDMYVKFDNGKINRTAGAFGTIKFTNQLPQSLFNIPHDENEVGLGTQLFNIRKPLLKYSLYERKEIWQGDILTEPIFYIKIHSGNKSNTIYFTDIGLSNYDQVIFIGYIIKQHKRSPVIVKSEKYTKELVYFFREILNMITKGSGRERLDEYRDKFKLIVQSIINKTKAPRTANLKGDTIRNLTQVVELMKRQQGTVFPDESESYLFMLFYQIGAIAVSGTDYSMTFRTRPDRVRFRSLSENEITKNGSAQLTIMRVGNPQVKNSNITRMTSSMDRLNLLLDTLTDGENINNIIFQRATDIDTTNDPYSRDLYIAALQSIITDLLDSMLLMHFTVVAGNSAMNIIASRDTVHPRGSTRQVGLMDKRISDSIHDATKQLSKLLIRIQSKYNKKLKKLSDSSKTIKVLKDNVKILQDIIANVADRVINTKTPSGRKFLSKRNFIRMAQYSHLDFGTNYTISTTSVITDLLDLFENLLHIALGTDRNIGKLHIANNKVESFELEHTLLNELTDTLNAIRNLSSVADIIKTTTGAGIEFDKEKKLTIRGPIPIVSFTEEFAISSPISISGNRKPKFQVVGRSSASLRLQLKMPIEDMFLSSISKITNVIEEEEGIDALYNLIQEPSGAASTVYNMLKAGRSIEKDPLSMPSTGLISAARLNNSELAERFRLIKRTTSLGLETEALGSLLGNEKNHLEIKEPFIQALGLHKFVAKTASVNSNRDEQSWAIDLLLLPYNADYTTSKNLKNLNKGMSNIEMGDRIAWLSALYDHRIAEQALNKKGYKNRSGAKPIIDTLPDDELSSVSKVIAAKSSLSHVFSAMVAVHAMYKAKYRVENGVEALREILPKGVLSDIGNKFLKPKHLSKHRAYINQLSVFTDLEKMRYAPNTSNSGDIHVPVGVSLSNTVSIVAGISSGVIDIGIQKWIGTFNKTLFKVAGWITSAAMILAPAVVEALIASESYETLNNFRHGYNGEILAVPLSQTFVTYAMDFLKDFTEAESVAKGEYFLNIMAQGAFDLISAGGGIQSVNQQTLNEHQIKTKGGYIKCEFPTTSEVRQQTGSKNITVLVLQSPHEDAARNILNHIFGKDKGIIPKYTKFINDHKPTHGENNTSINHNYIDQCGLDLVDLLAEGAASMSIYDISTIAEIPSYILKDINFYYNAMRSIYGRLKLHQFTIGLQSGSLIKLQYHNTINVLFDNGAIFAKPLNHIVNTQKDSLTVIAGLRYVGSNSTTRHLSFNPKNTNNFKLLTQICETDRINSLLGELVFQFPLDVLSKAARTLQFILSLPNTEIVSKLLSFIDTVKWRIITKDEREYLPDVVNNYSIDYDKHKVASYVAWVIYALTYKLNAIKYTDLIQKTVRAGINNAIVRELAKDLSETLNVTIEEAEQIVKKDYEQYSGGDKQDKLIQACSTIALYADGDSHGRQLVLQEYYAFLETFNTLVHQDIANLQLKATYDEDYYLEGGQFQYISSIIYNKVIGQEFTTTINGANAFAGYGAGDSNSTGQSITGVHGRINKMYIKYNDYTEHTRNIEKLPWTILLPEKTSITTNSSKLYYSFTPTDGMANTNDSIEMQLYQYAKVHYDISRPEFIPKCLLIGKRITLSNGTNMVTLIRSAISVSTLNHSVSGEEISFSTKFGLILNRDYFSSPSGMIILGVTLLPLLYSLVNGIMAAIAAGTITVFLVVIVAIVLVIVVVLLYFWIKSKASSLIDISLGLLKLSDAEYKINGKQVSPLFLSMKILYELSLSVNAQDILNTRYRKNIGIINIVVQDNQVYPPMLENTLNKMNVILNDTLSYLTLPLIRRRNANSPVDVIPPGGIYIPSKDGLNERASQLINAKMVNDAVLESELDVLHTITDEAMLFSQQTRSNLAKVTSIGVTSTDAITEFINRVQGIIITKAVRGYTVDDVIDLTKNVNLSSGIELMTLVTEAENLAVRMVYGKQHRGLGNELVGAATDLENVPSSSFKDIQDILNNQPFFKDNGNKLPDLNTPDLKVRFVPPVHSPSFTDPYFRLHNRKYHTLPRSEDTSYTAEDIYLQVTVNKKYIYNSVQELNSNSQVIEQYNKQLIQSSVTSNMIELDANLAVTCFNNEFIKNYKAFESAKLYLISEQLEDDPKDKDKQLNYLLAIGNYLDDLANFIQTKDIKLNQEMQDFDNMYMDLYSSMPSSHKFKGTVSAPEFVFIRSYAAKIVADNLENIDSSEFKPVKKVHVLAAFKEIASAFKAIVNTVREFKSKVNSGMISKEASTIGIDRKGSIFYNVLKEDEDNIASDIGLDGEGISTKFAADSLILNTRFIDLFSKYKGDANLIQRDTLTKVSDRILERLMLPLRGYPVAKLFFIEQDRNKLILFDDLYSYSDIISMQIFDSTNYPATRLELLLSNTDNKLDNILSARQTNENPFEKKALLNDPLSGLMLKAGTRLVVYIGYGNLLTDENKYLFEIDKVDKQVDGSIKLHCKGPGWVLDSPINKTGQVVDIRWYDVQRIKFGDKVVEAEDINSANHHIANNLIIYALKTFSNIEGYRRLGTNVGKGTQMLLQSLPDEESLVGNMLGDMLPDFNKILEKYTVNKMLGENMKFTAANAVLNAESISTLFINMRLSHGIAQPITALWDNATAVGNFFTSWFDGGHDRMFTWRIENQTTMDFIKDVIMNVNNAKFAIRSYDTDGSIVLTTVDGYYSLFTPFGFTSLQSNKLSKKLDDMLMTRLSILDIQHENEIDPTLNGILKNIKTLYLKDRIVRRILVDILISTFGTLILSDITIVPVINNIIQSTPLIAGSLPTVDKNNISVLNILHTLLMDSTEILKEFSDQMGKILISSSYNGIDFIADIIDIFTFELKDKQILDTLKFNANIINTLIKSAVAGKVLKRDNIDYHLDINNASNMTKFAYVFLQALLITLNKKSSLLKSLAPETRPIVKEHVVMSGDTIIFNNISAMIGYNEVRFVFERIAKGKIGKELMRLPFMQHLDAIATDQFPMNTEDAISVNPFAASGGYSDYVSRRLTVGLSNPGFFTFTAYSGIEESMYPLAMEYLSEAIQDWYDGMISVIGNTDIRPHDNVFIVDEITDMYGEVDVKEVVHNFSIEGFTSSIVPSMVVRNDSSPLDSSEWNIHRMITDLLAAGIVFVGYKLGIQPLLRKFIKFTKLADPIAKLLTKGEIYASKYTGKISALGKRRSKNALIRMATKPLQPVKRFVLSWLIAFPLKTMGWTIPKTVLRQFITKEGFKRILSVADRFNMTQLRKVLGITLLELQSENQGIKTLFNFLKNNKKDLKLLNDLETADKSGIQFMLKELKALDDLPKLEYTAIRDELNTLNRYTDTNNITALINSLNDHLKKATSNIDLQKLKVEIENLSIELKNIQNSITIVISKTVDTSIIQAMRKGGGQYSNNILYKFIAESQLTDDGSVAMGKYGKDNVNKMIDAFNDFFVNVPKKDGTILREGVYANRNQIVYGKYRTVSAAATPRYTNVADMFSHDVTNIPEKFKAIYSSDKDLYNTVFKGVIGAGNETKVTYKEFIAWKNMYNYANELKVGGSIHNAITASQLSKTAIENSSMVIINEINSIMYDIAISGAPLTLNRQIGLKAKDILVLNKLGKSFMKTTMKKFQQLSSAANKTISSLSKFGKVKQYDRLFKSVSQSLMEVERAHLEKYHTDIENLVKVMGSSKATTVFNDNYKAWFKAVGERILSRNSTNKKSAKAAIDKLSIEIRDKLTESIITLLKNPKNIEAQAIITQIAKNRLKELKKTVIAGDRSGLFSFNSRALKNLNELLNDIEKATAHNKTISSLSDVENSIIKEIESLYTKSNLGAGPLKREITSLAEDMVNHETIRINNELTAGYKELKGIMTDPREIYTTFNTLSNDMRKIFVNTNKMSNPFKSQTLGGIIGTLGTLYGTYYTVKNVYGDAVDDFALKILNEKVATSLKISPLMYKGEPYLSNMEGITKGDARFMGNDSHNFSRLVRARLNPFNADVSHMIASTFTGIIDSLSDSYKDINYDNHAHRMQSKSRSIKFNSVTYLLQQSNNAIIKKVRTDNDERTIISTTQVDLLKSYRPPLTLSDEESKSVVSTKDSSKKFPYISCSSNMGFRNLKMRGENTKINIHLGIDMKSPSGITFPAGSPTNVAAVYTGVVERYFSKWTDEMVAYRNNQSGSMISAIAATSAHFKTELTENNKTVKLSSSGNYVQLKHKLNSYILGTPSFNITNISFHSMYRHLKNLNSTVSTVGQVLDGGELLGELGTTGYSTGLHLHMEMWESGKLIIDKKHSVYVKLYYNILQVIHGPSGHDYGVSYKGYGSKYLLLIPNRKNGTNIMYMIGGSNLIMRCLYKLTSSSSLVPGNATDNKKCPSGISSNFEPRYASKFIYKKTVAEAITHWKANYL